ncbi:hypothetical protein M513_01789 [Trichuris suis]|uniref:TOG domain-containing protein n=1 Tax=Trichuris suis TaxID=68888 RepID=A0A085MJ82_9BILA|nr:hypothetical protein M513_01789 [Trichuris suis]
MEPTLDKASLRKTVAMSVRPGNLRESAEGVQRSPIVRSASAAAIVPPRGQVFDTPLSRSKSEMISSSQSNHKRVRRVTSKYAGSAGLVTEQDFYAAFSKVDDRGVRTKRDAANLMQTIRTNFVSPSEQWEKRVDALVMMRSTVMNPISMEEFWAEAKPLELKLLYCLKSLRSQLVREACITIAFLAVRLKAKFSRIAEGLLPDLLSLVQNHANVVSSSASIAAEFIFKNTQSSRLLPVLMLCFESKSREIRSACCNMLSVLLHHWTKDELKKQKKAISTFVSIALADADPNARSGGREAFVIFNELFPDEGKLLLERLDASKKRQLKAIFPDMTFDRTPSIVAGKGTTKKRTVPQSTGKKKIPALANFNETSADEDFSVADILSSARRSKVRTTEIFPGNGMKESYEGSSCTKSVNVDEDSMMASSLRSFANTPMTKTLQDVSIPSLLPLSMISTPSFLLPEHNAISSANEHNVFYDSAFGCLPYERECNEFTNRSKCNVEAHADRQENFRRDIHEGSPMLIKLEDSFIRPPMNVDALGTKETAFQRRPSKGGRAFFSSCLLEQIPASPLTADESSVNPEEQYLFSLNNLQSEVTDQKGSLNTDSTARPIQPYVDDGSEEEMKLDNGNLASKINEKEEGEEADALAGKEEKTNWTIIPVESGTDELILVVESPYAKLTCVNRSDVSTADLFTQTSSSIVHENQNGNEERSPVTVPSESTDRSVTVSHCEPGDDAVEDEAPSEVQVHEEGRNGSAKETNEIMKKMDKSKVHEEVSSHSAKETDETFERADGLEEQVPMHKVIPIASAKETSETVKTLNGTEIQVQVHEAITNDSAKETGEIMERVHGTEVQVIAREEVLNASSSETSVIMERSDGTEVPANDSAKEASEIVEAVDGAEAQVQVHEEVLNGLPNETSEIMAKRDETESQMQIEEEVLNDLEEGNSEVVEGSDGTQVQVEVDKEVAIDSSKGTSGIMEGSVGGEVQAQVHQKADNDSAEETGEIVEAVDGTEAQVKVHEEAANGSANGTSEIMERLDGAEAQMQVEDEVPNGSEKETSEVVERSDGRDVQIEVHKEVAIDSSKETSEIIESPHGAEVHSIQSDMCETESEKLSHCTQSVEPMIPATVECSAAFASLSNGDVQELAESSAETSILSEGIVWKEANSRRVSVDSMPLESEEGDSFLTANREVSESDISIQNLTEFASKRQHSIEEALLLTSQLRTSNDFRTKKAVIQILLNGCTDEQFGSAAMYEIGNALLSMYTSPDCRLRSGACQLWAYLLCVSETFREVVLSKSIDHMIVWLKCSESDEEMVSSYLQCILAILSHPGDWTLSLKKSMLWKLVERICDWQNVLTDRAEAFQLLHFVIHNARSKFFTSDEEIAAYVQKLIDGVFHDAVAARFFISLLLQIHSIYPVSHLESMIKQQLAKSVYEEYVRFLCSSTLVRGTSS